MLFAAAAGLFATLDLSAAAQTLAGRVNVYEPNKPPYHPPKDRVRISAQDGQDQEAGTALVESGGCWRIDNIATSSQLLLSVFWVGPPEDVFEQRTRIRAAGSEKANCASGPILNLFHRSRLSDELTAEANALSGRIMMELASAGCSMLTVPLQIAECFDNKNGAALKAKVGAKLEALRNLWARAHRLKPLDERSWNRAQLENQFGEPCRAATEAATIMLPQSLGGNFPVDQYPIVFHLEAKAACVIRRSPSNRDEVDELMALIKGKASSAHITRTQTHARILQLWLRAFAIGQPAKAYAPTRIGAGIEMSGRRAMWKDFISLYNEKIGAGESAGLEGILLRDQIQKIAVRLSGI